MIQLVKGLKNLRESEKMNKRKGMLIKELIMRKNEGYLQTEKMTERNI